MEISFTPAQEAFRREAREFLQKECPKSLVRACETDPDGYSPQLWQELAARGWLGLSFPKEVGGKGHDFIDLIILLEEMGRVLLPGPYLSSVVLAGFTLLDAGSKEQSESLLTKLCGGQIIVTVALTEPQTCDTFGLTAEGIKMQATSISDGYLLEGTKLFVPDANAADYIIVAARTRETTNPEDGVSLFIVGAGDPGVRITPLQTIAEDKQCEVVFNKVKIPKTNLLGKQNNGWKVLKEVLPKAVIAKCSEMVGGTQAVLDMSTNHAQERIQFGRPIGSFQAIQHFCANMLMHLEGARLMTYKAAWRTQQGLPSAKYVAMAKACASEAYTYAATTGNQIHGGIAYEKEQDMQLYFRRAHAALTTLGDPSFHREQIARELGL